jgi:formylmethanofuran dehydrogenase subunit A
MSLLVKNGEIVAATERYVADIFYRFVDAASTQAAKLFGLFPRKGTLQPGSDADLVDYDLNYRGTLSARTQTMKIDYNACEGMVIEGRPHVVTVRGQVAARDGKFVGRPPGAADSSSANQATFEFIPDARRRVATY